MLTMDSNGKYHRLTIIVPVYNEEDNIPRLKKELVNYLKLALIPTKVLFIDDGSTDNGPILLSQICEEFKSFDCISLKKNMGLSTALKAGFDSVDTDIIGYMDADLQTSPMDFNKLLAHIDCFELVTGIRILRHDGLIKRFSSIIANFIRRLFTKDGIKDTGCPLKLIKTDFAKRIPMFKGMHRFIPAMIILQNGRIQQIPVNHYPRLAGKSHYNIFNRIGNTLIDCFVFLWIKKRYINYEVKN